jgi:hypothetical protein
MLAFVPQPFVLALGLSASRPQLGTHLVFQGLIGILQVHNILLHSLHRLVLFGNRSLQQPANDAKANQDHGVNSLDEGSE